jgi:cysteine-rich repeat protein
MSLFRPLAAALVACAFATPAAAHIQLVWPPARSGTAAAPDFVNQKAGPCGLAGRSTTVTTLPAGATITVLFDELINHPGEFRIAFDAAGDDDLAPPTWDGATWVTASGVNLLAEHVPDLAAGVTRGEVQVTLPAVPCTACTLQLIQVMTDKPPFIGDNDFYFMCADLVLEAAAAACGNGVVDPGEACDDGNGSNTDACLTSCVAASCGDGFLHAGVEACDDGNRVSGDGCSATCVVEPPPPVVGSGSPAGGGGGCGTPGAGLLGLVATALLLARRRAPARGAPRPPGR